MSLTRLALIYEICAIIVTMENNKIYILFPQSEIIPCEGNITKCGHGCLTTDEGAVCVCPEGSILQEDGQACTGADYYSFSCYNVHIFLI